MQTVWNETRSENLVGAAPYVLWSNSDLGAAVLERQTDGRRFLWLRQWANESQVRAVLENVRLDDD